MTDPTPFTKDPQSTLDYQFDWTDWLGGDEIATSLWIVPVGLTQSNATHTTTVATVFLAGGYLGVIYVVTNRITTSLGRTAERSIVIRIANR